METLFEDLAKRRVDPKIVLISLVTMTACSSPSRSSIASPPIAAKAYNRDFLSRWCCWSGATHVSTVVSLIGNSVTCGAFSVIRFSTG